MRQLSNAVQFIKDTALASGFDACGIAAPNILDKDIEYLNQWLAENKHGNINYLEKNIEQKTDPKKILGQAKSVIALIKSYTPAEKQVETAHYKIAKLAWGTDYHKVLKANANQLVETLKKKYKDDEFKIFVDSNSILEKAWAARCGIGWVGKNTLLINKDLGSYVFIGIILTTLELNYDEILENHCGNCNACITACPTGAIEKPYQLNATKCIAYHTIEDSSSDYKSQNNTFGWIYGCDICQDVCPWNKDTPSTKEKLFQPNPDLLKKTKKEWEKLNEKVFDKLFANSSVKRIGFEKMKRNIQEA